MLRIGHILGKKNTDKALEHMKSFLNILDPTFWIVKIPIEILILLKERNAAKQTVETEPGEEPLTQDQLDYVRDNVVKHRLALWVIAGLTWLFWDSVTTLSEERLAAILVAASIMVTGFVAGWFAMSLKSLPTRYGFLGIVITFTMFVAFMGGLMIVPISFFLFGGLKLGIFGGIVALFAYTATLLFDFADLLNLGLEPLQKMFYRDPKVKVLGELMEQMKAQQAQNAVQNTAIQTLLEELKTMKSAKNNFIL